MPEPGLRERARAVGPVTVRAVESVVLRAPVARPVVSALGVMKDRPALFVRVEDGDGAVGWGEVWCNFPTCGAEHRHALLHSVVAPLLLGGEVGDPAATFHRLTAATHNLALQSGEPGPLAQVVAGVDIALWDLFARRAGMPLRRLLAPEAPDAVPSYASGIHPDEADARVAAARERGFAAFKLKLGFGRRRDLQAVARLRDGLRAGERFMVDANQAWGVGEAADMVQALAETAPEWLEEPIPADRPDAEWQRLAGQGAVPLAGGENLAGAARFEAAIAAGYLAVVQPDACKWGGVTGCLGVAGQAQSAGRRYCPHYLGGGVGLVASANLLAAVGGDGRMEVDVNPNPLRDEVVRPFPRFDAEGMHLPAAPGLGVAPELAAVGDWITARCASS